MTNKQLKGIVDSLLTDVAIINDFELDQSNPASVQAANFLLGQALEDLRETIVPKALAATKIRIPAAPPKKNQAEAKIPPTAARALSIEDAA